MTQVRVASTETEQDGGRSEAFVVAWPLNNNPAHINSILATAVREAVSGLQVVLIALDARGDLTPTAALTTCSR